MDERTEQLEILEGCVEDITFRNQETGFTVLELSSGGALYTVVGSTTDLQVGETVKAIGNFVTHPTFGPQFKARLMERQMPATASAILKYLSSGAIKGIGPATARKLVEAFGSQTLEVLEKEPERLRCIKGFSAERIEKISEEVARIFGMRTVMLFLASYGITPAESVLIWNKWGLKTTDMIFENPFALCAADLGIAFERADRIREAVGISEDSVCRVRGSLVYILTQNLHNGHTCLPLEPLLEMAGKLLSSSLEAMEAAVKQAIKQGELVASEWEDRIYLYLPELYQAEEYCAERFLLATENCDTSPLPMDKLLNDLGKDQEMVYDAAQKSAIVSALSKGITVLTGGPGTGKTTTVNAILSVLERRGERVLLTAPTGRAAKRLQEVTGREAKTIHRLLEAGVTSAGAYKFARNRQNPLLCDVLIVDEMSMVDITLMSHLLAACPLNARLVLVGDHNQLPSVGPGNVLRDLIDSEAVPVVTLNKIFRQAEESAIVTNAHRIIKGEQPDLKIRTSDFFFLSSKENKETAKTVCDLCSYRLPGSYGFDPLWDIQVIAPSKIGEVGTMELNRLLQESLNPPAKNKGEVTFGAVCFRKGDKVMQNRNNYDIQIVRTDTGEVSQGVFNGDIGVIESVDRGSEILTVRFEDKIADYAKEQLFQLELAYAITVHKSQGSEFEAVILPLLPGHRNLYYRNLFYTAVTRARKLLIILGREETVTKMVNNDRKSRRFSNLRRLLQRSEEAK